MNSYAIIMAGGNGERFWPLSTSSRPKQFLDLFDGKPLIRHAVDRLDGLVPPERIYVVTAGRLVALTEEALPSLPRGNILGEPCRRDTAAAVATACGLVLKHGGEESVGCILTADQLMTPADEFRKTLADAIDVAGRSDAVVTIGIGPTRPDTGFGYIECGGSPAASAPAGTRFEEVRRFVEKPDAATAEHYLASGNFLWNSGMFIWKASTMRAAFASAAADFLPLIDAVAAAENPADALARLYPALRTISVDFAVMEKVPRLLVARSTFVWDDVGAWTALGRHFPADADGNVTLGAATLMNTSGATVVNRAGEGHVVAVAGLKDAVVVATPSATLVCSKEEAANLKALLKRMNG